MGLAEELQLASKIVFNFFEGQNMNTSFNAATANREFLQLLTVQLQNQDPFEPVKQENFIAQLAQFSTLEGVEKLNSSFASMLRLQELAQGIDIVGRTVDYFDSGTNQIDRGRVSELFVDQGTIMLMINNRPISLDSIAGIGMV